MRTPRTRLARCTPALLALTVYVPLLLTHPGMIGADTKQYLYLDPSRMLSRAPYMWDPNVGMGTVTHQNIGYLLPMGPWYWTLHTLHVSTWIAQRLWIGTVLFMAGLGVVYLLRTLGWRRDADHPGEDAAVLVAALAFMLTPYVLEYEARISAILMPWAALPWMVGVAVRALRTRSWRYPALFALTVAVVGGVNATSLIFAGLAPVMWFPFAVWVNREVSFRDAAVTFVRVGFLTVLTSAWWMAGLLTQAGFGLDVLRYTETVQVVSQTGLPIEVLRGLGNWYFYGRDSVGPWVQPAAEYTQQIWRLTISYLIPVLAFVSAIATRWRDKLYFVTLIVVGLALGVGVYPYAHPSPLGTLFKAFANSSSLGLALRSLGRASPLVALGVAVLLGAGVSALAARTANRSSVARVAALGCAALVAVNMAPLFTGQFVDNNLERPSTIPSYWTQTADLLKARGTQTRVLELPGADFSHYRWGTTLDPVTPGIIDRPFVGRELIPYGSAPSADLLRALDRRMQEGIFEPAALAPIARLISAGDVVLRSDLQYERFLTPRPLATWRLFNPSPAGLSAPTMLGPTVHETPVIALLDETTLATPPSAQSPPAVAIFGVEGAPPIVRTEGDARPVLVAGDGEGLVDLAAAGLLDGSSRAAGPVLYAAALARDPVTMSAALGAGADLVLTDTNRRRGQRWGTTRDNNGYTQAAGETPLVIDPTDQRLPVFPDATDASFTVAEQRGVAAVRATAFGDPVSYAPSERPGLSLDGNLATAWKAGAFSDVKGDRIRIDLLAPVTTDHINLVQPIQGAKDRYITSATITFDGGSPVDVDLGASSRIPVGQTVTFAGRSFKRLDITVKSMNFGRRADYRGGSPVGFAEIRIPGVQVDEVLRLPTDLLSAAGPQSLDHKLAVVLTRMRSNPLESFVSDEELAMARTFTLPTARTFSLNGVARLSASHDNEGGLDSALGRPSPAAGGLVVRASDWMPGDLHSRPEAAVDGDLKSAWTTPFGNQEGNWIQVAAAHPVTLDHVDLSVIADGRHSVPTRLRVSVTGQPDQDVTVPPIADQHANNGTVTVHIPLSQVTGSTVRLTVLGVRSETTINYLSATSQTLPIAIAELGLPGLVQALPAGSSAMSTGCRTDLLTVDGQPVGVAIAGTQQAALDAHALSISLCGQPIMLGQGNHEVRAKRGVDTGINLDRLVFESARGGGPATIGSPPPVTIGSPPPVTGATGSPATTVPAPPPVTVTDQRRTSMTVTVNSSNRPFWLVLGQSHNLGWTAHTVGAGGQKGRDLGRPVLVDGYANGWRITPSHAGPLTVHLDWTPQHRVNIALLASALSLLGCLALAVIPVRRRWEQASATAGDAFARTSNLPALPTASNPALAGGRALPPRLAWATVAVSTALAAAVIGPVSGVVVGASLALVVVRPRLRAVLSVGSVMLLVLSALYVVQLQFRYRFPTKIEWPAHFAKVAMLPWIAAAFLLGDTVLEHLRNLRIVPRD